MSSYLRARVLPPLPRAQLTALVVRAQQGDQRAREMVLRTTLAYVLGKVAKQLAWRHLKDDLVQEGVLGLNHAIDRFDASRRRAFLTYASHWVKAYITRAQQRTPGIKQTGRCHRPLSEALSLDRAVVSLDSPPREGLATLQPRAGGAGPEDLFADAEEAAQLGDRLAVALDGLPDMEAAILSRHLQPDPPTLADIGRDHDLSRERIRQLEVRALPRLARLLGAPVRPTSEVLADLKTRRPRKKAK